MSKRSPFISFLLVVLSFLVLEGICFLLVSNNGIIQRYRLMEGVRRVQSSFWRNGENIRYYFSLKEANDHLVQDNLILFQEAEKYKALYGSKVDSTIYGAEEGFLYKQAKVVRNSTDRQHNYIIIDKGSNDGVKEDMGVITPYGVVGYVHSVGKRFSMVVSFLDIDQSISAIIKSNGTFGPLRWNGKNIKKAILHEIPLHTSVTPGDTIITSGYSAIYPADIPLGTIESAKLIDGINYDVTVKLFLDYSSLHYVFLVKNINAEELSELNEKGEGVK